MDFSPVINQLITVEEANELLTRLEELKMSLYGREEAFKETLYKINVRYFNYLNDGLKKGNQKEYLNQLIEKIKGMEKIRIETPFIPSQKLVEKISLWLNANLGRRVLLTINSNSSQSLKVGLEWQGKYGQF